MLWVSDKSQKRFVTVKSSKTKERVKREEGKSCIGENVPKKGIRSTTQPGLQPTPELN